jgi:enoyl-CoA hydratase/carnithine racemase
LSEAIRLETATPIAEIVLNQPAKRNALSIDMWAKIPDLVASAEQDSSVSVLIIHGGASKAFASGADISEFSDVYATPESSRQSGRTIARALEAIENCPKPVIAAIEGACVGGGVSLAMAADLRVAGGSAVFGITPGKLGLVYPAGDTRRLVSAIGPAAAKDLLFTGRLISAEEAQRIGLVGRIVPDGHSIEAARIWAGEIAAISQWSVRAAKRMIAGIEAGWRDDESEAEALFLEGFSNQDFAEGYRAFLEKRKARFTYR